DLRVVNLRKHFREEIVHAIDQRFNGAVVGRQFQKLKGHSVEGTMLDIEKQTDLGLAEAINGLHRIPHQKQCAAVARLPSCGQFLEQLILSARGILKFVNQQVFDACIETKRE